MRLALTITMILNFACATTQPAQEPVKPKSVTAAFYTLKEGDRIENKLPLPNKTQILVNWTYSDGEKKTQEGFRGWDIDHDGRFDMLEVLDKSGKPNMWAFDFDGDGVIDAVEKDKSEDSKKSDEPLSVPSEAPIAEPATQSSESLKPAH